MLVHYISLPYIVMLQGPEDVKAMGIGEYNKECRKIVMRYSTEWKVCDKRATSSVLGLTKSTSVNHCV